MDVFGLGLMCLSGAVVVLNAVTDAALWPLSATLCPPGQKMTLANGCDDARAADSAGAAGQWVGLLCCVLSAGALWWHIDAVAALIFAVACCLVSLGTALVSAANVPQPPRKFKFV